jgi:hypothetical protein
MSPIELLAYQYIKKNPGVGAVTVSTFLSSNYAYIRNILASMAHKGLIINKDVRGNRAKYVVDKRRKID